MRGERTVGGDGATLTVLSAARNLGISAPKPSGSSLRSSERRESLWCRLKTRR
jgi:hypothetical protein